MKRMIFLLIVFLSCSTQKTVKINSEIGKKEIKSTLKKAEPDLKRCLNDRDIGKASFYFEITLSGEGEPESIEIERAKKEAKFSKGLRKCLKNVIYETDFPLPESGKRYDVKHRVNFLPEESFSLDQ